MSQAAVSTSAIMLAAVFAFWDTWEFIERVTSDAEEAEEEEGQDSSEAKEGKMVKKIIEAFMPAASMIWGWYHLAEAE
jgi:hypothetical protein